MEGILVIVVMMVSCAGVKKEQDGLPACGHRNAKNCRFFYIENGTWYFCKMTFWKIRHATPIERNDTMGGSKIWNNRNLKNLLVVGGAFGL
jgi:hypothetical protein